MMVMSPLIGGGEEPQPGPSHRPDTPQGLQYNKQKKSERTYTKNVAIDRTYQVKVSEKHHGERLEDHMFNQVLNETRGDLEGNDLGRVVIQHDS